MNQAFRTMSEESMVKLAESPAVETKLALMTNREDNIVAQLKARSSSAQEQRRKIELAFTLACKASDVPKTVLKMLDAASAFLKDESAVSTLTEAVLQHLTLHCRRDLLSSCLQSEVMQDIAKQSYEH